MQYMYLVYVFSSFVFFSLGKRELVAYFNCLLAVMYVSVLCLFLMVPWVGLQCMIMVFPDQTHLLFVKPTSYLKA